MQIDLKAVALGEFGQFLDSGLVIQAHILVAAQEVVFDDGERRHVEWFLIEHADAGDQSGAGRIKAGRLAVGEEIEREAEESQS